LRGKTSGGGQIGFLFATRKRARTPAPDGKRGPRWVKKKVAEGIRLRVKIGHRRQRTKTGD